MAALFCFGQLTTCLLPVPRLHSENHPWLIGWMLGDDLF